MQDQRTFRAAWKNGWGMLAAFFSVGYHGINAVDYGVQTFETQQEIPYLRVKIEAVGVRGELRAALAKAEREAHAALQAATAE